MSLGDLPPEWQYYIFTRITKEEEWKRFRRDCPYYELIYGKCSRTDDLCLFEECPLRKGSSKMSGREMRVVVRKGSLLERNVARMFQLIGIEPQLNAKVDNYEIDVLLTYQGRKIAVECKQYEKSSPTVRNLIHEWNSKSKELGIDKVLLVISGYKLRKEDDELARKYGIALWDEERFDKLFSETLERRETAKDRILLEIGIEPYKGYEEVVKNIKDRVFPLLSPSSTYEAIITLLACYGTFGWMVAGIIASLSPNILFIQAFSCWLIGIIVLSLIAISLRSKIRRKMCKGLLLALKEFHKIRETVTVEELTSVSSLTPDKIEKLLKYLEKKGRVHSPYKGNWKLKQTLKEDK